MSTESSTRKELDARDTTSIARLSLHDPANFYVQLAQTQHRLNIVHYWNIAPGKRVLELGCGQGDCTTVLAEAVGEKGSVTTGWLASRS